ncbi:MmcQ/YjbR family DNA-binding protein [Streptococcus sp. E17BB]|uniref:MmcQ/YjbR family DNA-binding protein n=1 Tax=Streptococcus sp. E17BB TaxID=3278714 RepID=UPI00359EEB97
MLIEDHIFQHRQFQVDKLLAYGFKKDGEVYRYKTPLLDGQCEAHLMISEQGQVSGCLIDTDLAEEYTAFRTKQTGAFVGQVREAYQACLEQIAHSCCSEQSLVSRQGQALERYLSTTFGDVAEVFGRFKGIYSFKHPANQKWYGLALRLPFGKLDLGDEGYSPERLEEEVEVINIKIDPAAKATLIRKPGIYPSYHMNKQHWVTIVLDGGLTDEQLVELVTESRELVSQMKAQSNLATDYWIIPANPKHYDIDNDFASSRFVSWPQKKGMSVGHTVYIYLTAPDRCLRYACRVVEVFPDRQEMLLECLATFSDHTYPMSFLQEHGVTNIRSTRRMTKELVKALAGK